MYRRFSAAPSGTDIAPTGNVTYTFSTGVAANNLNSWTQNIPTGTDPVYMIAASASNTGATDTIAKTEWSTPIKILENGQSGTNGTDGYNQATIYLYQRKSGTAPAKPSSAVTYTFSTGALSSTPSGWSRTIPANDGNPCYVTTATAIAKTATYSIAANAWSAVVVLSENGTSITITSTTVKYQKGTSGTTKPTGTWGTSIPSIGENEFLWTQTIVNYSDGSKTEAYSVSRNAINGTSPTVSSTVVEYQQSTGGTTPPTGTWSSTAPSATAGQYMWTKTTITYSDGKTAVSYSVSKNGSNGINGIDGTSQNLLLDVYASSLTKVKAPWDRYLSDSGNTTITGEFIAESNLPDPNATHFYRITDSSASTKSRGLCFYNGGTPPFLDGHTYRIGCWVRNHAGEPSISFYLGSTDSWINRIIITNTNWEWIECVRTFGETDPAITAQASTYKRLYFYFGNSNVEGSSLDMCGFKVEEVQTDISTARNYLLKTEKLDGWGVTGGATISNGVATFPEVTANTWREIYPTKNFKYELIRNKNIIFSTRVKADTGKICCCNFCIGVDATETAYNRQKYRNNYVYFTGDGEWHTICVAIPISDGIFASGSGTPNYDNCWVTVRIGTINTYHNSFQATQPQLSLGTTATAWSAAPEDIEANIQQVQTNLDNLEIGGRNLLLNTNKFDLHKHSSGWVFNDNEASITATTKSWLQIDLTYNSDMPVADVSSQPNMELLGNGDATLSIEAKCEGEINGLFYFQPVIYGNNNNRKYYLITNPTPNCINGITLTNEWKRYNITFPVDYTNTEYWTSDSTQLSYPNTGFGARVYWNSTGTVYIRKPKLERGQKATDWTSAPEDTQADIDTALAQSVEYIIGTQTAATGTWTGVTTDKELKVGKTIAYKLPYAGSGNASLVLTLADGSVTNAIPIYLNTTRVTTHFGANSVINMTYDGTAWRASSIPNTNETNHILNNFSGKTGELGIWQTGLFMKDGNGTYQNICTDSSGNITRTNANTKKANPNGFEVGSSIYLSTGSTTYAANSNISGAVYASYGAFDSRYSLNTTLTAGSLTPYMPVYLTGTINDVDGLFHLDTVWWTQTPTDPDKVYILVGGCYDSTTSYCRITLYEQNSWYKYVDGALVDYSNNLAELAATTATAFIAVDTDNNGIMVHPKDDMASGWQIGNAIQLFKNGISYIRMWIQDNIPKIRIGDEDKNHIVIDDEAIKLYSETKELATYSTDGITFDPEISYKIGNNNSYISFEDEDNNKKLKIVADSIEFTNTGDVQKQLDDLQGNLDLRDQYIKIDTGDAEATPPVSPSITIAASLDGEATNLKLEPDKLSFQVNGQSTATMANDKMNIPTASVTNLFMESSGYQKIWVMRENGHLSLKAGK